MKTRKEFLKFLGLGVIGFVATMSTEVAAQSKKTVDKKVAKKDEAKTTHPLIKWTGPTVKINKRQCATCQRWKAEWQGCPCRKYYPASMSVKTAKVNNNGNFPCTIKNSTGSGSGTSPVSSCREWTKWVDLP